MRRLERRYRLERMIMSYRWGGLGAPVLLAALAAYAAFPGSATAGEAGSAGGASTSRETWLAAVGDGRACEDFSYRAAGSGAPQFSQFKAAPEKLTPAPARITAPDPTFRTAIRRGAAAGPNFAGHYTFVDWGVGAGGRCWVIADAKTGRVSTGGLKEEACLTIQGDKNQEPQFRIDSRLLILSGHLGSDRVGVAYYEWNGSALEPLRFYSWDQLCPVRIAPKPNGANLR
jgi:hypothetical protein